MKNRRKKKLISPSVQLPIILLLMMAAGLSMLLQTAVSAWTLTSLAGDLPQDGATLQEALPGTLALNAVITLAVALPAFFILGLSGTFRIFGPLYRFRVFLSSVAEGKHPAPCKLRKGDLFQDVCELLNEVTEESRAKQSSTPKGDPEPRAAEAA